MRPSTPAPSAGPHRWSGTGLARALSRRASAVMIGQPRPRAKYHHHTASNMAMIGTAHGTSDPCLMLAATSVAHGTTRSEERRVGKEWRPRWAPQQYIEN